MFCRRCSILKGDGLAVVQHTAKYFVVINLSLKILSELGLKCGVRQLLLSGSINVVTIFMQVFCDAIGVTPVSGIHVALDKRDGEAFTH